MLSSKSGLICRSVEELIKRRFFTILCVVIAALAAYAWSRRFILDDAFISFRYAKNFVEGNGLVWNPGESVEGYTNFLWTLIMSIPFLLGLDPIDFCMLMGPVLAAITLFSCGLIALELFESRGLALLAVLMLGVNPSFSAFATSGLETQLLCALQTTLILLVVRLLTKKSATSLSAAAMSVLAALAVMTRLDSAVVCGIAMCFGILFSLRTDEKWRRLGLLILPGFFLVTGWLVWKMNYYGDILPNTYYSKMGMGQQWARGWTFLRIFFTVTWLAPFPVLFIFGIKRAFSDSLYALASLLMIFYIQCIYVASVGGDFMEFRFMVPLLPIFFVLIIWFNFKIVPWRTVGFVLSALVFAGAIYFNNAFSGTNHIKSRRIESIGSLGSHLDFPSTDWAGIGRKLNEVFGSRGSVLIAVAPAGAIPFYAGLPAVDMLGQNDKWIAANGLYLEEAQPGHQRIAPTFYLVARGVNLVIAHPWVIGPHTGPKERYDYLGLIGFQFMLDASPQNVPSYASVLQIPLDSERSFMAVYLTPHPDVDKAISEFNWKRYPVIHRYSSNNPFAPRKTPIVQ